MYYMCHFRAIETMQQCRDASSPTSIKTWIVKTMDHTLSIARVGMPLTKQILLAYTAQRQLSTCTTHNARLCVYVCVRQNQVAISRT